MYLDTIFLVFPSQLEKILSIPLFKNLGPIMGQLRATHMLEQIGPLVQSWTTRAKS